MFWYSFLAGAATLGYNASTNGGHIPVELSEQPHLPIEAPFNDMNQPQTVRTALFLLVGIFAILGTAQAAPYELSEHDVTDPKSISSPNVLLFGVKLGDPEPQAIETLDVLVNKKALGIKVEHEGTFVFLLDQRKPTGPMAGIRIQDGKVDLLFINNRFAHKTRGIFRNVLNSESPDEIRKLLGQEDYGDENVMGAIMAYDKQGFQVNYLGKDINIEFAPPR